jgi:polyribonucleotide nucleotidyltransferase
MDIKIDGLKYEIMEAAWRKLVMVVYISLENNRNFGISKRMLKLMLKIITRRIPNSFIGALIGPGGKVIQELQKTGTTIVSMKIQLLKKVLLKS